MCYKYPVSGTHCTLFLLFHFFAIVTYDLYIYGWNLEASYNLPKSNICYICETKIYFEFNATNCMSGKHLSNSFNFLIITDEIFMVEESFCQINCWGNHRTLYSNNSDSARIFFSAQIPKSKPKSFKNHQKIAFFQQA